mmetsp:Transcript_6435/g.20237  ORF Transcript_6435/g.20237 Transcript_6435/m.20237 type:complete len:301 (+) Transcript_6435:64-966(+)
MPQEPPSSALTTEEANDDSCSFRLLNAAEIVVPGVTKSPRGGTRDPGPRPHLDDQRSVRCDLMTETFFEALLNAADPTYGRHTAHETCHDPSCAIDRVRGARLPHTVPVQSLNRRSGALAQLSFAGRRRRPTVGTYEETPCCSLDRGGSILADPRIRRLRSRCSQSCGKLAPKASPEHALNFTRSIVLALLITELAQSEGTTECPGDDSRSVVASAVLQVASGELPLARHVPHSQVASDRTLNPDRRLAMARVAKMLQLDGAPDEPSANPLHEPDFVWVIGEAAVLLVYQALEEALQHAR